LIINRRHEKFENRLWFSLFLSSTFFWALSDLSYYLSGNAQTVIAGRPLTSAAGLLGASAFLVFTFGYTHKGAIERFSNAIVALFVVATLGSYLAASTDIIYDHRVSSALNLNFGYDISFGSYPIVYLLWVQFLFITVAVILFRFWRKQKNLIERKRSRLLFIAVIVPIVATSVTNIIFPFFDIIFPPMGLIASTIMSVIITYGLYKYQLFLINPASLSTNILATMSEGVVVVDRNLTILYLNNGAKKLLKVNEVSHLNNPIEQLFTAQKYNELVGIITNHTNWQDQLEISDFQAVEHGSKRVVDVDISISSYSDQDGITGFIFVFNDISDLKQAYAELEKEKLSVESKVIERTEQLHQEQARLNVAIQSMPIGFVLTNQKNEIVEMNSFMNKLKVGVGTPGMANELFNRLPLADSIKLAATSGEAIDLLDVEYEQRIWHIVVAPVRGDSKVAIGTILLFDDITQARQAERERNQFIVTASHEMRTPMTIIEASLSSLMSTKVPLPEDKRSDLMQQAHDASVRMGKIFQDILNVSGMANIGTGQSAGAFKLSDLVAELKERLRPKVSAKGLEFKLDSQSIDATTVTGDYSKISQILERLVDNAIKFTDAGSVTVSAERTDNQILINVIDSGKGIAESDQADLFKKFSRVNAGLTREQGGTGLGLYISQNLARQCGGKIVVKSQIGAGSCFTLILPRTPDSADQAG